MVIEDVFAPPKKLKTPTEAAKMQIAAPIDRLAALVGEMPIFIPILTVFLSPFRHDISVAELTGSQTQIAFAAIGMVATTALAVIIYQTFFIYFFGATPGKYFVGLKVVSIFDQTKPTFMMSLMRALSMCLEMFMFGFPWLASLSHPQRRVLHDRLSDTYVMCLDAKKATGAPILVERQLAKNFQAPGWALFLLAIVCAFNYFSSERKEITIAKEFEATDRLCSQVTAAMKDWHSLVDPSPSRVAVALALYEAQSIDETCLEKESLFSLWRNQDKDMGYLAQAIAHSTDDIVFSEYLDKVCTNKKDGDACKVANDIEADRDTSIFDIRAPAAIERVNGVADVDSAQTDFMRIHIEKKLHENNQLNEALKIIDTTSTTPYFADFLNLERLKIMWEMDRMLEARAVFQSSRVHLDESTRLQISNWMCSAEILNGCTHQSQLACRDFISDYDGQPAHAQTESVELNYIRAQKCLSKESMDYASIDKKLSSERAHDYLSAVELVNDRKVGGAKEIFRQIADQSDSDEFQTQANADLVALSQTKVELDYFFEEFLSKSDYQSDPKFAFELLRKYSTLGDFDKVSSVGENLLRIFPFKTSVYAKLFSEAMKHKNYKFAEKIQTQFKKMRPESKALGYDGEEL